MKALNIIVLLAGLFAAVNSYAAGMNSRTRANGVLTGANA